MMTVFNDFFYSNVQFSKIGGGDGGGWWVNSPFFYYVFLFTH